MLKKILIVDDSAALHQIYQMTLSRYLCPVLSSLSGLDGLDQLALNPDVDLLIVDMYMQPRMGGIEFITRVKEQDAFRNIPVIAVISRGEDDSQEANQLADGVLKKPFTSREIHLAVETIMAQAVLEPQTS